MRGMMGIAVALSCAACLPGCGTMDRSLIFFTNTNVGLDVGVDPKTGEPAKLVLGYKRQEGVLNPVYDATGVDILYGEGSTGRVKKYQDEAYSVIARYQGSADANAGGLHGGSTNGQWFATGEAAKLLAKQPGIAGAVTGSDAVGLAAAKQEEARHGNLGANRQTNIPLLTAVFDAMVKMKPGDPKAGSIVDALEALDSPPHQVTFTVYAYDATSHTLDMNSAPDYAATNRFRNVLTYWATLSGNITWVDVALKDPALIIARAAPASAGAPTPAERLALEQFLTSQRNQRDMLETRLNREPKVLDAVQYFVETLQSP